MKKKVVVFGSFVVDLTGRTPRLPIPGETVMGSSFAMGPGGKGSNQAVAAHRCGYNLGDQGRQRRVRDRCHGFL